MDSMQVYRGMDIGSAKPSLDERARVPHHVIDMVPVGEPYDAARFVRDAEKAEHEIRCCGRVPIFCGGTGLYLKVLLDGLGESPASDPAIREEIETLANEELVDELRRRDPATYESIDRSNRRRLVRALEVIRITGRPFSEQRTEWEIGREPIPNLFVTERDREDLIVRIETRVDRMFEAGLVEETRGLLEQGLEANPTAMQAIGYRQVVEHLREERPLDETVELIKVRTRQFAKRQRTWFRHQLPGEVVNLTQTEPDEFVEKMAI